MVERTRIGLIFSYDENWIGGAYYILNIIHALNLIEDKNKPHIVILTFKEDHFKIAKTETSYPYLSYHLLPLVIKYSLMDRAINKIGRVLFKKNIITKKPEQPILEVLYPYQYDSIKIKGLKKINWIPDFQEEFLPHFFTSEKIAERKEHQKNVVCKGDFAVFSSENAKNHFTQLYPTANAKTSVIHFAVTHPDFSKENIESLKQKYQLPSNYFFAPNQFWAHKNHKVILNAVKLLKDKGQEIVVAFSGKENDHRNTGYVGELKTFIKENDLEANIKFLGFIERTEQLCILQHSIAVIQPSLFEGWSTVVEDTKSIGKHIVLSNIEVHQEQIQKGVNFFNPLNSIELSEILGKLHNNPPGSVNHNYQNHVIEFGNNFLALVNQAKIEK